MHLEALDKGGAGNRTKLLFLPDFLVCAHVLWELVLPHWLWCVQTLSGNWEAKQRQSLKGLWRCQ